MRLLLLLPLLMAACATPSPPADDALARLDAMIRHEMADKDIPTLSITVVDTAGVLWSRGYGPTTSAADQTASGETVYRVASISKLFTAMAVMQLAEAGRVDLDAPVTTYLPDFQPENPYGTPITLRQIMSHRSGLVREPPVGHYFDATEPSLAALVESLNETALVYAPTTLSKYSNAAVSVAGHVVEAVTGQPFAAYVAEHLFAPMGMASSSFVPTPALTERLATGYMWTYDGRTFPAPVFELGMLPAANLYTTTDDLGRFLQAVLNAGAGAAGQQVLSPEALGEMGTPAFAEPGTSEGFGLGFYVSTFEGTRRLQHSGVMYGYATRVYALPERGLGVAVVSTMDATNNLVDRIGSYALSLLMAQRDGRPLPDFVRTAPVDTAQAWALAGRYEGPSGLRELSVHEDDLVVFNGTESHRLRSLGDTLIVDDRLAYGARYHASGNQLIDADGHTFTRVPDARPPEAPAAFTGLLGEYGWDHNVLYLLERDGQLWALIEWFFYYPLAHIEGDVYRFPAAGLYQDETLAFTRGPDGQATQASLSGVVFPRRDVGPEAGDTFQITPQRPLAQLAADALAAVPPTEDREVRPAELVELITLDPTIRLDVRYATDNNFMGAPFYPSARAFLQRPAAEALVRAHQALAEEGLGVVIYDGYRPWYVTKMFWDATPDSLRTFVANPANGSRHNRGSAVDLGLYDRATGAIVPMVSGYDEFTARAYPDYPGGTALARWYRHRLRRAMAAEGFRVYRAEWWHFDHKDWPHYGLQNVTFDQIGE